MTTHIKTQSVGTSEGADELRRADLSRNISRPLSPKSAKQRRWKWLPWMIVTLALAIGALIAYRMYGPGAKSPGADSAASTNQAKRGGTTPVVARRSIRGNLPIYFDGVGTAQALNTVTVHSRVDGELVKVLFDEGQFVKKDDLIAEIDPRSFEVQLAQTQAQQAKDQAALDNSKRDLERYEIAKEAVPKQQLDTATSQVAQFEAAIKIDQAAIDNANLVLSYTKISAPISGRMGLRTIDAGNMVHASDAGGLAVITQVQPIAVVFTLAQSFLPQVQKAMQAEKEVVVLAYDTTLTQLLATGKLAALDNQIDLSSGTFKLKAVFDNTDFALFPNQFVNVRLLVDTRKSVVQVPAEAIQHSPTSTFVDVIDDDNVVEQRDVTVGPTEADMTVIEQGVNEGEMVATSGLDRLQTGGKVVVQSEDAARSGRGGTGKSGAAPSTQGGRRGGSGRGAASGPASMSRGTEGAGGTQGSSP